MTGAPAPAGMRIVPDAATRLVTAGAPVVVGGSPTRVLRLTEAGARQVADWFSGTPVADSAASRKLARRLLDAGIAHPVFPAGSGPARADVSVVIPVKDRQAELARCLDGLAADRAGCRVIVVDDCSADADAIAKVAAGHGATVIRRPVNGGPGAARNTGLAAAATEFVAFLDSDCVPRPGWLDGLLPHFADPAVGAAAPRIVPFEDGPGWLARYEGASSTLDMGARPSVVRPGSRVPYVPGAALVVRRAAAGDGFAAGMFVGEDVDFVWRTAAAGWTIRYEPSAVMGHDHRVTFRAWFSRRADYGTSAAALEELHPGAVRPLYASWWTAGAWAAFLSRRPVTGAAVTATATALLSRRLAAVTGERWPLPGGVPAYVRDFCRPGDRNSERKPQSPPGTAWRLAARLAGGGTLAAGRPLGSALSRTWWPAAVPAAVAVPRLRLPVAALMLAPPLLDWADRRPPLDPVRYTVARLLDDAAYSVGVWQGCLRRRTARPLLPSLGSRPDGAAPGSTVMSAPDKAAKGATAP